MSQKHANSDQPRMMERREFLGVGAAAGASAYLGQPPLSATGAPVPAPRRATPSECIANRDGPIEWAIPAQHVTTLWTLLWPRVAARVWLGNHTWPDMTEVVTDPDTGEETCQLRDISHDILVWIESFLGREEFNADPTATPPLPDRRVTMGGELGPNDPDDDPASIAPGQQIEFSERFREALVALHEYLRFPSGRPKIRRVGAGGYDLLLSEQGIDLWSPPVVPDDLGGGNRPGTELLMRHYELRRAGRPSIGIGNVFDPAGDPPVPLPEAPTGPSQVEVIDPCMIPELCVEVSGNPLEFQGIAEGALEKVDHIEARAQAGSEDWMRELERVLRELGIGVEPPELGPSPAEATEQARRQINEATPEARIPIDSTAYECHARGARCWVLSGSVFRGVLEQFPRVVAATWEDNHATDVRGTQVRTECEQRMETLFPQFMRFEFDAPSPNNPDISALPAQLWDEQQLMITNAGLFFPRRVGAGAGNGTAPTREDLLVAIVQGRAGNPVFTDSSRCL